MMRKQEEAAEDGFKSPRFFPSAGKERREKVPKRARGENEGQVRARGKKTETQGIPTRKITSVIQRAAV